MFSDLQWKGIVLRRGVLRLIALLTFAIGIAVVWNWQSQPKLATCFIVNLPPVPITPTSEQITRFPNDDSFLTIRLESDNSLKLNSLKIGSLTETEPLTVKLREIFEQRRELGVFDEKLWHCKDLTDDERTVKKVVVAAPNTAKYVDVVRVIDAVKSSGTNDVWLQIDGENFWWIFNKHLEAL
jgi:biopolymer transport protein ExbD